jgi:hypothetical protein
VLLVPMTSVTLYTLMTFSFGGCQPGRCQERFTSAWGYRG